MQSVSRTCCNQPALFDISVAFSLLSISKECSMQSVSRTYCNQPALFDISVVQLQRNPQQLPNMIYDDNFFSAPLWWVVVQNHCTQIGITYSFHGFFIDDKINKCVCVGIKSHRTSRENIWSYDWIWAPERKILWRSLVAPCGAKSDLETRNVLTKSVKSHTLCIRDFEETLVQNTSLMWWTEKQNSLRNRECKTVTRHLRYWNLRQTSRSFVKILALF